MNPTRSETVEEFEVGIVIENLDAIDTVPPGEYDIPSHMKLETVSCFGIPFALSNPKTLFTNEAIVFDNLSIEGDIFRDCPNRQNIKEKWWTYKDIFLDDEEAKLRVLILIRQAVNVCSSTIPQENNDYNQLAGELEPCIGNETNSLAQEFGLSVENLQIILD